MDQPEHVPLGVGFYPDWWWQGYQISFGRDYYFDPDYRVQTQAAMARLLHQRFGEAGLGNPDPPPRPLITFGMVMLPALYGCEIVFEDGALPWAMPLNLSKEDCRKLTPLDLASTWPMKEVLGQIEHLKAKYGRVVGDINVTGVQNLALKLRGEELYIDYYEDPQFAHGLLQFCAQRILELWRLVYPLTGSGAMDVTPMCDPKVHVVPNCTVEQISGDTYLEFGLPYDTWLAQRCQPYGIHHCGSVDPVIEHYAKVPGLVFLEAGFGSDFARARRLLGPEVAFNARISPVLMKNGSPEEVAQAVREAIDQGPPLGNYSIDTVGLTFGVPDQNVRAALATARQYGRIV